MADVETKVTEGEVKAEAKAETKAEVKTEEKKEAELSAKELNDKLQEALTELAKIKRERDKNAAEAKEFKDKYRETLSVSEKASEEKAEAEARREEQYQQLLRENTINKVEKNYLAMGWTSDEASRMAIAEVDNDLDAKVKIMSEVDVRKKKEFEAEFIKSRPDVNIGSGSGVSYTKEQFDKMGVVERSKLFEENPAEYNRLMKL